MREILIEKYEMCECTKEIEDEPEKARIGILLNSIELTGSTFNYNYIIIKFIQL